jgi:NAD(P)-dependent dehydrogenase (short-subunit alcohol dehydrogenase family)
VESGSRRLVLVADPLEGRVAIVTGGGGGLAEGICARLASDGAAVAAVDVSREKAERIADQVIAEGGQAMAVEADVSDRSSVEAMVDEVARGLGGWTSSSTTPRSTRGGRGQRSKKWSGTG